jgi:hypothetical protein
VGVLIKLAPEERDQLRRLAHAASVAANRTVSMSDLVRQWIEGATELAQFMKGMKDAKRSGKRGGS